MIFKVPPALFYTAFLPSQLSADQMFVGFCIFLNIDFQILILNPPPKTSSSQFDIF